MIDYYQEVIYGQTLPNWTTF